MRKNKDTDFELALTFLNPEIVKEFTKELVLSAMIKSDIGIRNVTQVTDFEMTPVHVSRKLLIRDWHVGKVMRHLYRGGINYEGYADAQVQTWRVPTNYMSLAEGPLMATLLKMKFPYLKRTKFACYGISIGLNDYEFYVETEKGTLYVPFMALTSKDPGLVTKRMTSYFEWSRDSTSYELNKRGAESLEDFKKRMNERYLNSIAPLESKKGKWLLKKIAKG